MKTFTMTVDVEPDTVWGSWKTSDPISFRGVFDGIERIQSLANEFAVGVTYFIQPVILFNDACIAYLQSLSGLFECATHLHGEYIEPEAKYKPDFAGSEPSEKQRDYAPNIEKEKLKSITKLFVTKVGYEPKSFRAGRFGASKNTCKFLRECNYTHDSSVIPGRKQFAKNFNLSPYFCDGMIEVPVTIYRKKWLRPTPGYSSFADMRDIALKCGSRNLCCMIHNVEVVPKINPYCETEERCLRMLDDLRHFFEFVLNNGYTSKLMNGISIC